LVVRLFATVPSSSLFFSSICAFGDIHIIYKGGVFFSSLFFSPPFERNARTRGGRSTLPLKEGREGKGREREGKRNLGLGRGAGLMGLERRI